MPAVLITGLTVTQNLPVPP